MYVLTLVSVNDRVQITVAFSSYRKIERTVALREREIYVIETCGIKENHIHKDIKKKRKGHTESIRETYRKISKHRKKKGKKGRQIMKKRFKYL